MLPLLLLKTAQAHPVVRACPRPTSHAADVLMLSPPSTKRLREITVLRCQAYSSRQQRVQMHMGAVDCFCAAAGIEEWGDVQRPHGGLRQLDECAPAGGYLYLQGVLKAVASSNDTHCGLLAPFLTVRTRCLSNGPWRKPWHPFCRMETNSGACLRRMSAAIPSNTCGCPMR